MNTLNILADTSFFLNQSAELRSLVSYSGIVDSQSIRSILKQSETNITSFHIKPNAKKIIVGIIAEMLQNILHHSSNEVIDAPPSFLLKKSGEMFIITTANLIDKNRVEPLQNLLEKINSYSPGEIKRQHLEILKNGKLSGENAGLGLIDIVRKSGNPIVAKFSPVNNNYYLFTVNASVKL